jgi:hypothetical protein
MQRTTSFQFKQFTFTGVVEYNQIFHIQVIATSVEEARVRAVDSLKVHNRKEARRAVKEEKRKEKQEKMERQELEVEVPFGPADSVQDFTGCFCNNINELFKPCFRDPRTKSPDSTECHDKLVPFDVWIQYAKYTVEKFDPLAVRVISCLDG